jgi:cytochrome c-type biogenesis protein CcmH
MAVFWILAVLMTGVALAFVLVPLLRPRPPAGPSADDANLAVLRGQRSEIESDVASGVLPPESRDEALAELVSRAEQDLQAGTKAPETNPKRPWAIAASAAVAIPALAIGLYVVLGSPVALEPQPAAAKADAPFSDHQIVEMVESLAKKVRERPDDAQGWSLLARSLGALGRYDQAAEAYAHLAKLVPGDASLLADYADALAMSRGRNLAGQPYDLVKAALKIDPKHQKALALAGTAALNEGDFATSMRYWETLAAQLTPGSEDEARVRSVLEEIRGRAAAAGKPLPNARVASTPRQANPPQKAAATAGTTVSGTVTLGASVAGKVGASDTLFIFARAQNGPRIPLAVLRGSPKELPKAFQLDDSMAMAPGMQLSSTPEIRVEARISKSGNAVPQPGDLVGTSTVVKPGARDVKIVIDRVLP